MYIFIVIKELKYLDINFGNVDIVFNKNASNAMFYCGDKFSSTENDVNPLSTSFFHAHIHMHPNLLCCCSSALLFYYYQ